MVDYEVSTGRSCRESGLCNKCGACSSVDSGNVGYGFRQGQSYLNGYF